jgi:hypothetical protein
VFNLCWCQLSNITDYDCVVQVFNYDDGETWRRLSPVCYCVGELRKGFKAAHPVMLDDDDDDDGDDVSGPRAMESTAQSSVLSSSSGAPLVGGDRDDESSGDEGEDTEGDPFAGTNVLQGRSTSDSSISSTSTQSSLVMSGRHLATCELLKC